MKRDRLHVKKELLPYRFSILLADELFEMGISYNENHDFFTVSLSRNGEILTNGERVVYGIPLFRDINVPDTFPAIEIVPLDESGNVDVITYDNTEKLVFLTVNNAIEDLGAL